MFLDILQNPGFVAVKSLHHFTEILKFKLHTKSHQLQNVLYESDETASESIFVYVFIIDWFSFFNFFLLYFSYNNNK